MARLALLLLGVELCDELYSGVPSVGSADIQETFGASYALTSSALLLVPSAVALLVEPVLFVLADRYPRRWFVCGGLLAMALAAFAAAAAPNVVVLTAALSVAFLGSGCGVALSQATLVDAAPHDRERALTRWALLGELGDLLAPGLMATVAVLGMTWRSAYVVVGALVLTWAILLAREPFPDDRARGAASRRSDDDEHAHAHAHEHEHEHEREHEEEEEDGDDVGVVAALGVALQNRRLLFWLGATALCDLLDEIVVVFAALYLRDHLGAGPVARSVVIGMGVAGAVLGVVATERLLAHVAPLRLLLVASLACGLTYGLWLLVPHLGASAALFFLVGATAAPLYPIASAEAYAALPGRSGTVNAAGHLFTPLLMAAPWLLGVLADHLDVRVALAVLLVQPLGLALAARHGGPTRRTPAG